MIHFNWCYQSIGQTKKWTRCILYGVDAEVVRIWNQAVKGKVQESLLSGVFSQLELKPRCFKTKKELKSFSLPRSLHLVSRKVLVLIVANIHVCQERACWLKEFPWTLGKSIRPRLMFAKNLCDSVEPVSACAQPRTGLRVCWGNKEHAFRMAGLGILPAKLKGLWCDTSCNFLYGR